MSTLEDYEPADALHCIVYGGPGSGKTVFAHGFPRTRTLDFDNGMGSVAWAIREGIIDKDPSEVVYETILETNLEKGRVTEASVLDRATDTLDLWLAEKDDWDTLVIDSVTAMNEAVINKGLEENARLNLSKSRSQSKTTMFRVMKMQDWGAGMNLFEQFIQWVRADLPDKNIVVVAHQYENRDDAGNLIALEPLLIGQLRQKIAKDFGEVYYIEQTGTKGKPKYELLTRKDTRHVTKSELLTRKDTRHVTKSRLGCLPTYCDASYSAIRKHVEAYWA